MAQIKLERTPRLKAAVRKKPYFMQITPGVSLGYRRNQGPGAWLVRVADGKAGNWMKGFAIADDAEKANNDTVMDYAQALVRARVIAGADRTPSSDRPITIDEAVDAYETDLETRGASPQNAKSIRFYLNGHPALKAKPVALVKKKDLTDWRNSIVIKNGVKADTANRVSRVFKAALTLAASNDERITNINAWKEGLKALPSDTGSTARDLILSDDEIGAIVEAAYAEELELGIWFQTLAETGVRESQVLRLEVYDLQDDRAAPRLMMPSSRKGRNRQVERKPLPISLELAQHLKRASLGKRPNEPMFSELRQIDKRFKEVADRVGGIPAQAVPYSFRHSSIVRMLLRNVPVSVVASHHDTSAEIIQKHYARFISNVSDSITRDTLPDFAAPAKGKVVRIGRSSTR
jgi:integrase